MPLLRLSITLLATALTVLGQASVTTQSYDNNRTSTNPGETILNTSNVNVATFGKLFSRAVDAQIYAQPLYVPNLTIPGQGVHNVVFVCTENNSVYAFDADSQTASKPLWQVNLGPAVPASAIGVTRNLLPIIGISSTPVIDPTSNTIYVVAESYENSNEIFRVHALDITSGAEKFNGPTVISGSVSGTGTGSVGGILAFNPTMHWQRAGLALSNSTIYIGFGSHLDNLPFFGWIFGYNATTLQRSSIICLSPNSNASGVWQSGQGLVIDSSGYMYVASGQGAMDANSGGQDFGDSYVKLNTSNNALTVVDYFSPSNDPILDNDDLDIGAGGATLIPGAPVLVGGGKDGRIFVMNTNSLGQYHSTDQMLQEWQGSPAYFGAKPYYNSNLYAWGRGDYLKAYAFNGSTFSTTPTQGTVKIASGYSDSPALSVSAHGTTAGTGILWASYATDGGSDDGNPHPGILRAFDASNIATELWNSTQNQTRDNSGSWAKWCPPTVANGKVYLPTWDNILNVYGLVSGSSGGGLLAGSSSSSASLVDLTIEGMIDWEHWGDASLNRKAGVTAQLTNFAVVGTGGATIYTNDPRPITWSDGTPTVSSSSNTNGVFMTGQGGGFSFTAPADTSTRTLVVHVGGWNSGGTLTAHLSDASAPDFVNISSAASGQYDINYTLTYAASSSSQTLTVTWVLASGTGNVTLNAAALAESGSPSISATAGTPQSATVGAVFATRLQATVKDASGNPVSGVTVTFTAPGSGASAAFSGSATASSTTNTSGVATAPALTANSHVGSYVVTASISGVTGTASFSLTNTAVGTGSLAGSGTSSAAAVDLTAEGTVDWEHWTGAGMNHKAGVTPQLGTYTVVGTGTLTGYGDDPRLINWSDGTPVRGSTNNGSGLYIAGIGVGYTFTAPADTSTRTLIVHVGGWNSGGTLRAHLSDGSAPDFVDVPTPSGTIYDRNYTLTYNASASGQTLTVTWTMSSGAGNVTLSAAALEGSSGLASISATAGTPQSTTVGAVFATALQATVKDASGNPVSGATVTFTAPGSGASAAFSGSATANSVTNASGVATAPALTANSQPGSYTVMASTSGAGSNASFSLTNNARAAASISATAGTPQSATVGAVFATGLQATVKDASGNPVSGASVTFTAPGTGASAAFSGSASASSTTNASGVATAPALTANSTAGSYTVTASVSGVTAKASFSLTNNALGSGALAGSGTSSTALVNLTSVGTVDWEHWDSGGLDRKAGVTAQLGTDTVVGSTATLHGYGNDLRLINWSDGTPVPLSTNNGSGLYIAGAGEGYSFTAPADTTTRTLLVYVGGWNSGGTLRAHLSDGSAADFVDVPTASSGQYDRNYTLTYSASAPGQTLTVTWTMSSGAGNVTLNAAALQ